jgi:glycosyltransferase involved in cell wall biosynthesis
MTKEHSDETTCIDENNHTPRLKIAVLVRSFVTSGGGAERYAVTMAQEIAKNHDVHVFAQTIDTRLQSESIAITFHTIPTLCTKPRWINQLWFALATQWAVGSQFDVIHSHELTWLGNVQTVHVLPVKYTLFHKKTGVARYVRWLKVITSLRLLSYVLLEKKRFAINGKENRTIIATSQTLADQVLSKYPHLTHSLSVIPPGISCIEAPATQDLQNRERLSLGLPERGYAILFIANDFLRKGLTTAIEALHQLPENYYLVVVGHAQQRSKFTALINSLNLSTRIFFLGSQSDMSRIYRSANCLAHPTLEDTFAMVVLEAMAHGLPVIVSCAAYCGISALLIHEKNALLLDDPYDAQRLYHAIETACTQPIRKSLTKYAQQFAANYLWVDIAKQQQEIYNALSR